MITKLRLLRLLCNYFLLAQSDLQSKSGSAVEGTNQAPVLWVQRVQRVHRNGSVDQTLSES